MKLSMIVFGVMVVLTEKFSTANLQLVPVPVITSNNSSTTMYGNQVSPEELKEIHDKAKSISHLKGPIINDSKGEPEYRRSLIRKLRLKTKSLALRKVITLFQNSSDEMILPNLEALEFLVHEYDTAIDFVSIGGMELLKELIQLDDKSIASAALSVLSAAMQGNPKVQKIASENHILDILLAYLASKDYLPGILYAVSSYLRHMPDSQMMFVQRDGINLLVDIMKNYNNTLKFRMHAIGILSDISFEMFQDSTLSNLSFENMQLIKEFNDKVKASDACKEIALLLKCNEYNATQNKYYIHEKVIDAMKNLQVICNFAFQNSQVKSSIEKLIVLYYPYKLFPWYSNVDIHLQSAIYQDLTYLYKKVYKKEYTSKIEL